MPNPRNWAYNLLRKSERLFKTDMIYVARSGFWLTLGQVVSVGLAFISSLFFANVVPKEVYGNYKFIIATTSILGALSLTGMGTVVVQAVARGAEGVFGDAVRTTLKWGVIMLGAAILSGGYYFAHDNSTLGFSFLIAGASMLLINSYSLYGNYLVGKKNFKDGTVYNTISQIVITTSVILMAVLTKNILAIVSAYFIMGAATTIFFYRRAVSKNHLNSVRDDSLIAYSKHISVMNFFGTFANQLDKVLIFHYLGAANLAIYVFAQAIPDQFKGAFKNLFGIAFPKYATIPESDLRSSIIKKVLQLTAISVILALIYIFSAPFIFNLLFPKYIDAIFFSQIYILGLITIPGITLFGIYFQVKKDVLMMYRLTAISHISTIIVTVFFVYKYGLLGAVIANGLSWLIMLLAYGYYFLEDKPSFLSK
ncbi:oligosaccharide flippase family protein [Candidatus Parcubacteria bacterium]|nr:oligosaccharide flippase family protein [Candidatus Parcubacteria bacterium]